MANSQRVKVEGLQKLINKIDKLQPPQSTRIKRRAMDKSVKLVRADVAKYPAQRPPANSYSWYERGFGTRTTTGLAYPTSETLGRRWTDDVSGDGNKGTVGNNATYAQWVQDEDHQTQLHKATGWPTVQKVIRDRSGDILDFFSEEYGEVIDA